MVQQLLALLVEWARDSVLRTPVRRRTGELRESQWWSLERLVAYQEARLREVIDFAYHNSPFYQSVMHKAGVSPEEIRRVDDLRKLPILDRNDLRYASTPLLAPDSARRMRLKWNSTGGTTGEPFRYRSTWQAWAMDTACLRRTWEWAGYQLGARLVSIGGPSLVPQRWKAILSKIERVTGRRSIQILECGERTLLGVLDTLVREKPEFLRGYPSVLAELARCDRDDRLGELGVSSVIVTGEVLTTEDQESIERAFRAPVFDGYGCRDGGAVAAHCESRSGLHWAMERAILEVVDESGEPVTEGRGEVVVTDLWNVATPFIRYRVGDIVTISCEPCACGRGLQVVQSIEGRTGDRLRFESGAVLTVPAVTLLFREIEVHEYRLRQHSSRDLEILVVPRRDVPAKGLSEVVDKLRAVLGAEVTVTVRVVDTLPRGRSGKRCLLERVGPQDE